ncbi:MAG: hypothetical protein ACLPY1_08285 [Terracidiphilus sp.]
MLEATSDRVFLLLLVSTGIVAIGIAFEWPEVKRDFTEWWRARPSRNSWLIGPKPERSKIPLWSLIGFILVIVGVALEGVFEGWLGTTDTRIRNFDKGIIASTEKEASQANDRASENEKEAAQLRKDAAELEDSISWRRLTPGNHKVLQKELDRFSVQRTWFIYNINDVEAFNFAHDLADSLPFDQWNPTEPEPITMMREGPVTLGKSPPIERGVFVSSTGEKPNDDAANALVKAIRSFGFDCTKAVRPPLHPQNPSPTVYVFVEPRPEGPQGEAKLRAEAMKRKASSTQVANH